MRIGDREAQPNQYMNSGEMPLAGFGHRGQKDIISFLYSYFPIGLAIVRAVISYKISKGLKQPN